MTSQNPADPLVPDGVKRVIRSDADSAARAEKGPYAREVEDYTDETVTTPADTGKGGAVVPRSTNPAKRTRRGAPAPQGAKTMEKKMAQDPRPIKSKDKVDLELSEELESTFPSSDPPSITEPGGGITGAGPQGGDRSERVRKRAYDIWLDEGQVHGRDEEHWREAERQVDVESEPAPKGK